MSDREEICELVVRFADAVNRLDVEQFERTWAAQATWIIDPPTDYVSKGTPAEIAKTWLEAMQANWASFTQLVQGTVVDVRGDAATARSYLTERGIPSKGTAGYFNHGRYLDELERTDEGWRFRKRRYGYLYIDGSVMSGVGAPLGRVL